jgi:hypothetical protein
MVVKMKLIISLENKFILHFNVNVYIIVIIFL